MAPGYVLQVPKEVKVIHAKGTHSMPEDPIRSRSLLPESRSDRECSRSPQRLTRDKLGRLHYTWPRTGPLRIHLRSTKFYSSNITNHCADLKPLIHEQQKSGKNSAVLIVDGGPDWSVKSSNTFMELGNLWRSTKLDHLMALSYAPYQSRFNPIEHAWSPRSNDLTGLRLSATLEGETTRPSQQSGLSEDDILRKEAVIHDLAIATVAKHWEGKKYDEFNVTPVLLESLSPSRDVTFERYEQICKYSWSSSTGY